MNILLRGTGINAAVRRSLLCRDAAISCCGGGFVGNLRGRRGLVTGKSGGAGGAGGGAPQEERPPKSEVAAGNHADLSGEPLRPIRGTEEPVPGFVATALRLGANALLGAFVTSSRRFDGNLKGMVVERISKGFVRCSLVVGEELQNTYGSLHGGAICTIVDVVGTIAVLTIDPRRAGVSVELNTSFLSSAPGGSTVEIEGTAHRVGRKLAFTSVDIFLRLDNGERKLVATGRHTKAV
jgi:acyl-coenzyme A thioesterase 13